LTNHPVRGVQQAFYSSLTRGAGRAAYTVVVMLALNTGMRYSEIRLSQYKQVDFRAKLLTVGKSKTQSGTGRVIPLNSRILGVLQMWASQFSERELDHYVFPSEKCGANGQEDSFGFTGGATRYQTDPTRPIGDWKEACEKAKERAAAILNGEQLPDPTQHLGPLRDLGTSPSPVRV